MGSHTFSPLKNWLLALRSDLERAVLMGLLLFSFSSIKGEETLSSYLRLGDVAVGETYGSAAIFYENRLSSCLSLKGGMELSTTHMHGFGALSAEAVVFFPLSGSELQLSNRFIFHHYSEYRAEDFNYRLALTWRHPHVDLTAGNVFQARLMEGSSIFEVLSPTLEAKGRLKPLGHGWNLWLSVRNFDDFVYEFVNWRVGVGAEYRLNADWRLLGEVVYSPSGVFNFAANYYELYGKIGFIYQLR